ncbi:vesicle-associated membrane protein 1 isoform X1 [Ailuropoda melanoleuca]|uniref:vesicle-associated membrane protein 1 isoform X1 n=2 Tax=Ailuropoda melanoleuca TaxID=9646 RepID=UPI0014945B63|nr:vesicle-associated membrane protein 1 isoform X1 [Ailuropoda melanoleuca]
MSAPAQPPAEGAEGTAPGGGPPGPPPNTTSNRRLQQTQAQVEEVVDIMRVNVDKVLKRDEILSQLDDRADALQVGASQFESSAAKLKRKYWWKNCKMMIMLGAICAIIVVVIVNWQRSKCLITDQSWCLRMEMDTLKNSSCSVFMEGDLDLHPQRTGFLSPWPFPHDSKMAAIAQASCSHKTSPKPERRDKESQNLSPNDAFCPGKEGFPKHFIGQKWISCPF